MDTITAHEQTEHERTDCGLADDLVDVTDLVCPGCRGAVVDAPPAGWPTAAGVVPGFSHPDGSVLCPDGYGRVPEPVERCSR